MHGNDFKSNDRLWDRTTRHSRHWADFVHFSTLNPVSAWSSWAPYWPAVWRAPATCEETILLVLGLLLMSGIQYIHPDHCMDGTLFECLIRYGAIQIQPFYDWFGSAVYTVNDDVQQNSLAWLTLAWCRLTTKLFLIFLYCFFCLFFCSTEIWITSGWTETFTVYFCGIFIV